MNNQKTMNKLVETKFKMNEKGDIVKIYNYHGKTGVFVEGIGSRIYDVDVEAFVNSFERKGNELIEMTRQVRERELGNADIAYEVIRFENGKVVRLVE